MANNSGKTVATLLIGAAIGAAAGYIIGTDKEKRDEQLEGLKSYANKNFQNVKDKVRDKFGKHAPSIEQEIYSE